MNRLEAINYIADQLFESPTRDATKAGLALAALGVRPAEYAAATGWEPSDAVPNGGDR